MKTTEKDEFPIAYLLPVTCGQWGGAWQMVLTIQLVINLLCNVFTTCTRLPLLLLLYISLHAKVVTFRYFAVSCPEAVP